MTAHRASPLQEHLGSRQRGGGAEPLRCACAIDISGALDAARLRRAVMDVAARHPALSAAIEGRSGDWRVEAQEPLRWTERACDALPAIDIVVREAGPPYGSSATLYTMRSGGSPEGLPHKTGGSPEGLLHESEAEALPHKSEAEVGPRACGAGLQPCHAANRLVLVVPALRADEASLHLIANEICRRYLDEPILPPSPLPFAAVADWQWTFLDDEESRGDRDWWTRETTPPLRLDAERAAAGHALFRLQRVRWRFGDETADALLRAAARPDAPLAAIVFAAWRTLLARISRGLPRLIGVAVDGRSYDGLEHVAGPFEKCVPRACEPLGDVTARDAIRAAAGRLHDAALRQEYCPPELAAPLGYQLACRDAAAPLPSSDVVRFRLADAWSAADCRLRCTVRQMDGGVHGELMYDANVFANADVEAWAESFERLCHAIARRSDAVLAGLDLLSPGRRSALIARSRGERRPRHERTLSAMFDTAARETPARAALVTRSGTLTYAELHRRACGVAAALRAHGVAPGDVVPVVIDRSPEAIVAILGALLAGAAYSPIETRQPPPRRDAMLAALGSRVLLTTAAASGADEWRPPSAECRPPNAERRTPSAECRTPSVFVEQCAGDAEGIGVPPLDAASLCSVIFTSGSSGEPKGVAIEHRHVASYLDALEARFGVAGLSVASMSTLAADLGNTAVFGALCLGGTLLLPEHDILLDRTALGAFFAAHPCDCMKIVPGHAAALLTGADAPDLLPRRYLFCGGEPLSPDLVARVRELRPECVVVNHYGPTECTIGVMAGEAAGEAGETLPLGRPLANNDVYVVDESGDLAPPGAAGELCVGGAQVARGYWRDAAASAARFVPDPCAPDPGRRMYRTGDLGVLRPDGQVVFLGRLDDQVKVAGFRVEPAEIAAVLLAHPDVADAAAFVDRSGGEARIAAFVVPKIGRATTVVALREHVRATLPPHMVPAMAVVDVLPRNANGKLDRDAFAGLRSRAGEPASAPGSAAERAIAEVWCAALGVPAVGVDEHFFDAGGHSLMLIQMHARLQERFGSALTILHLFEYPTIESLARFLTAAGDADGAARARERGEARARALASRSATEHRPPTAEALPGPLRS